LRTFRKVSIQDIKFDVSLIAAVRSDRTAGCRLAKGQNSIAQKHIKVNVMCAEL